MYQSAGSKQLISLCFGFSPLLKLRTPFRCSCVLQLTVPRPLLLPLAKLRMRKRSAHVTKPTRAHYNNTGYYIISASAIAALCGRTPESPMLQRLSGKWSSTTSQV